MSLKFLVKPRHGHEIEYVDDTVHKPTGRNAGKLVGRQAKDNPITKYVLLLQRGNVGQIYFAKHCGTYFSMDIKTSAISRPQKDVL